MELIREPLHIDFVVDSRPLTKQEEQAFSNFIRADKEKRKMQKLKKKTTTNVKKKQPI
ncbi:MAG: hypothetical protein H6553_07930 [Chitinophagales bacterium]|nr:hypothetical protein [Chitinophagales bacterium]